MATGERKTYVTQQITSKLLLDNIGFKIDLHCTLKKKKLRLHKSYWNLPVGLIESLCQSIIHDVSLVDY